MTFSEPGRQDEHDQLVVVCKHNVHTLWPRLPGQANSYLGQWWSCGRPRRKTSPVAAPCTSSSQASVAWHWRRLHHVGYKVFLVEKRQHFQRFCWLAETQKRQRVGWTRTPVLCCCLLFWWYFICSSDVFYTSFWESFCLVKWWKCSLKSGGKNQQQQRKQVVPVYH